jgi:hypothetical protein
MNQAGIARVKACFENAEEIFPIGDARNREAGHRVIPSKNLPQLPQLPQQQTPTCRALTEQEDAFEERAAIIEFDGGLPRELAEFLAGKRGLQ